MTEGLPIAYNELVNAVAAPTDGFDADYCSDLLKSAQPLLEKVMNIAQKSQNKIFQPRGGPDFTEVAIKISYQGTTKLTQALPKNLDELYSLIQTTFGDLFVNMPDFNDFTFHFIDSDGEKCAIENEEDLFAAYMHAKQYERCILKLYMEYKHGLTDKQKCMKWAECFRNDGDIARKRQYKERSKLREYSFMKGNCIVRDGHVYEKYKKTHDGKLIYRCEDFMKLGCKGRWIAKITAYGGEFGNIDCDHSFPPEMHTCKMNEDDLNCANPNGPDKKQFVQISKQEVKKLIVALAIKTPSITRNEVITEIKSSVAHADLPPKVEIEYILHKVRRAIAPGVAGYGLINVENLKTLRNTQFGREMYLEIIENLPRLFLFMYSDWQESIIEELNSQGDLHLCIDLVSRCCPRTFKQLMNFFVFDKIKKIYIPIGHALIQTKKKQGYLVALKWMKDKLSLNPKYITADFIQDLRDAITEVFCQKDTELDAKPLFMQFCKSLWRDVMEKGLNKPEYILSAKCMVMGLQALCFANKDEIISRFISLQEAYAEKSQLFDEFLTEFAAKCSDGCYQPHYWSYKGHEEDLEDLIASNNSIESFNHLIKTQLSTDRPNVAGFADVMSRVETLKSLNMNETCTLRSLRTLVVLLKPQLPLRVKLCGNSHCLKKPELLMEKRYLKKLEGKIETSKSGEVIDQGAILEDEILSEHSEELKASFAKIKKHEDSVKDILAQENLCMNLTELVNLKKEEGLTNKLSKRMKKEQQSVFRVDKDNYDCSGLPVKKEMTLEQQSFSNSQDSVLSQNFGNLRTKIKAEGYDSSSCSEGASQVVKDLDITRSRVDIAERILLYADNESSKENLSQSDTSSQFSLKKEDDFMNAIIN
ncbi:unnamed protein product [Moneuplotes crassus]|uniref:PB1 domain-containing protein n=1 Tax=Euplotes crassus TaxID=5936 RepID=A0AAD2D7Q9_EUPCR|nr:unnamed protein product [Moneuplotes crassus]